MKAVRKALLFLFLVAAGRAFADRPVSRELHREGAQLIYVVNERAPSLSAVARELYGDRRMAYQIAKWNNLNSEAWLNLGDRLKINKPPRYSSEQGTDYLIKYWEKAGTKPGLVARLRALRGGAFENVATSRPESSEPTTVTSWPLKGVPPHMGGWLPGFPKKKKASSSTTASAGAPPAPQPASQAVANTAPSESGQHGGGSYTVGGTVSNQPFEPRRRPSSAGNDDKGEPKSEEYWLGKDAARLIDIISRKVGIKK